MTTNFLFGLIGFLSAFLGRFLIDIISRRKKINIIKKIAIYLLVFIIIILLSLLIEFFIRK